MELDFQAVRALSSPTRIQILSEVLEKDRTPTELSRSLDRSKSTVSSHLSKLEQAGLVEKDAEEGRRRVTYSASRKAEAIVEGKERRVKFSVASSAFTGLAGIALLGSRFWSFPTQAATGAETLATQAGGDAAGATASTSSPMIVPSDALTIGLGLLALTAAFVSLGYTIMLHRLPNSRS